MPGSRFPRGGEVPSYHLSWAATARRESSRLADSPRGTGIRGMQAYVILPVFTLRSTHGD